jgi:hypothetical protein
VSISSPELSLLLSKLPLLTKTLKEPQSNLLPLESTTDKQKENLKSELILKSLAPLNPPSKPLVYINDEKDTDAIKSDVVKIDLDNNNNNITSVHENNQNGDLNRVDEKAKLESILQNTMNQTNSIYHSSKTINNDSFKSLNNKPMKFGGIEANSSGANNNVLVNGAANASNWVSRLGNRIPPPNYVCTICKIPGHFKSLCPEAVSQNKRSILSNVHSRMNLRQYLLIYIL